MTPRLLAALIAGLLYLLHPHVTLAGHAVPVAALLATAEVVAAVVLLRACWRSLRDSAPHWSPS